MTPAETATVLRQLHGWLKGGTQWAPTRGAEAVETAIEMIERLEAAESARRDDYQNWMTALDRNAELLAKLEAAKTAWKEADKSCYDLTEKVIPNLRNRLEEAEKDIAMKEEVIDSLGSELNAVANERDDLLARIREMEQQEPVAWLHETRRDSDVVTTAVKHVWEKVAVGSMAAYSIPLYLAPGAKGE